MWVAAADSGLHAPDLRRALGTGLTLRPLAETARDVLAFERTRPLGARAASTAMTREREAALLEAWRVRRSG